LKDIRKSSADPPADNEGKDACAGVRPEKWERARLTEIGLHERAQDRARQVDMGTGAVQRPKPAVDRIAVTNGVKVGHHRFLPAKKC
jgi:hypothetical protein